MFLKLIRGLDGVFYAFAVLCLCLVHPAIGHNQLGQLDQLCWLPVAFLAWSAWRLPSTFYGLPGWPRIVFGLRFCAVGFAGFFPFAIWWGRSPESEYLLINAALSVVTAVGLLLQVNVAIAVLAAFAGDRGIELEARLTRFLVLYVLLVPLLTLLFVLAVDCLLSGRHPQENIQLFLEVCPWWARMLALIPVVFSLSLLVRTRLMLAKQYDALGKELL